MTIDFLPLRCKKKIKKKNGKKQANQEGPSRYLSQLCLEQGQNGDRAEYIVDDDPLDEILHSYIGTSTYFLNRIQLEAKSMLRFEFPFHWVGMVLNACIRGEREKGKTTTKEGEGEQPKQQPLFNQKLVRHPRTKPTRINQINDSTH